MPNKDYQKGYDDGTVGRSEPPPKPILEPHQDARDDYRRGNEDGKKDSKK
jgi:hypothetical protein